MPYRLSDEALARRLRGEPPPRLITTKEKTVEPAYIPKEDIHGKTEDGRDFLLAAKGIPISMDQARKLGLVKDQLVAGPSEHKELVGPGEAKDGELTPIGDAPTPTGAETTATDAAAEGDVTFTASQPLVDAAATEEARPDVVEADATPEGEQSVKTTSRKAKVEKHEE